VFVPSSSVAEAVAEALRVALAENNGGGGGGGSPGSRSSSLSLARQQQQQRELLTEVVELKAKVGIEERNADMQQRALQALRERETKLLVRT
jgi:hypothetical protein